MSGIVFSSWTRHITSLYPRVSMVTAELLRKLDSILVGGNL